MTTLTAPLVGMRFHPGAPEALSDLGFGDGLRLQREPENQYDENAIQVYTLDGVLLGYVKREFAADWAGVFDEAGVPPATLTFESSGWPQVQIDLEDEPNMTIDEIAAEEEEDAGAEAPERSESDALPESERGEV
jgi:hypothetical protein